MKSKIITRDLRFGCLGNRCGLEKELRGLKDSAATGVWTNPFESYCKTNYCALRGSGQYRMRFTVDSPKPYNSSKNGGQLLGTK